MFLEEVELSDDRRFWLVTLSYPAPVTDRRFFVLTGRGNSEYKVVKLLAETGQFVVNKDQSFGHTHSPMTDHPGKQLQTYSRRGVVIDSNLLLLIPGQL